jgi:hypothetical protein
MRKAVLSVNCLRTVTGFRSGRKLTIRKVLMRGTILTHLQEPKTTDIPSVRCMPLPTAILSPR